MPAYTESAPGTVMLCGLWPERPPVLWTDAHTCDLRAELSEIDGLDMPLRCVLCRRAANLCEARPASAHEALDARLRLASGDKRVGPGTWAAMMERERERMDDLLRICADVGLVLPDDDMIDTADASREDVQNVSREQMK